MPTGVACEGQEVAERSRSRASCSTSCSGAATSPAAGQSRADTGYKCAPHLQGGDHQAGPGVAEEIQPGQLPILDRGEGRLRKPRSGAEISVRDTSRTHCGRISAWSLNEARSWGTEGGSYKYIIIFITIIMIIIIIIIICLSEVEEEEEDL